MTLNINIFDVQSIQDSCDYAQNTFFLMSQLNLN